MRWHGGHVTVAVWDGGFCCCFGVVGVKGSYPGSTWKSDRPSAKETLEVMLLLQYWVVFCFVFCYGEGEGVYHYIQVGPGNGRGHWQWRHWISVGVQLMLLLQY